MTRDDIIRMAREAGWNWPEVHTTSIEDRLERFAALVAAAERERAIGIAKGMQEELQAKFEQTYMEGVIAGAAAEREACLDCIRPNATPMEMAAAIRARGHAWARDRLARHGIQLPEDDHDGNPSF